MRRAQMAGTLLFFFCLLAANARADTIFFHTASFSTFGTFDCRSTIACSGEGTNTVTFGSGDGFATLTFNGTTGAVDITNGLVPVTLGSFTVTASDGFIFPTHPANPVQPIVRFFFQFDQTAPTPSHRARRWEFGPGGSTTLGLEAGLGYSIFPGPIPGRYGETVYTITPFPFTLVPGQTTALTAQVGAAPEPASMVLLGTGLIGAAALVRRRRKYNKKGAAS